MEKQGWVFVFIFREQFFFLLTQAGKDAGHVIKGGWEAPAMWRRLSWAQTQFPPPPAPSLTCWQLQMGKIWAWSYEQDRWEREESRLVTTAQGHGDGKLLRVCCCTPSYIYYERAKARPWVSNLTISRFNCNRYLIQDATFQSKHGRLTLKDSPLPLKRSPLCYLGFPLWRIVLCGPFMGQGASYAPVLVLCWWISSLWACGNKLDPSIHLHMARPIHLL